MRLGKSKRRDLQPLLRISPAGESDLRSRSSIAWTRAKSVSLRIDILLILSHSTGAFLGNRWFHLHLLFRDHDNRKEKATTTAVTTSAAENASWLRGVEAK